MQGESPLCKLKNPTIVYMITWRLSSCKTGVYNVRLLIILERGCNSMYRKKKKKKKKKGQAPHTLLGVWEYLLSTKVYFESMHTRCFRYFRKIRSPFHDFFFKSFQKSNSSDFQFYLGIMKNSPYRCNKGIVHVFSCINICRVPRKLFNRRLQGRVFKRLPRELANVDAMK